MNAYRLASVTLQGIINGLEDGLAAADDALSAGKTLGWKSQVREDLGSALGDGITLGRRTFGAST